MSGERVPGNDLVRCSGGAGCTSGVPNPVATTAGARAIDQVMAVHGANNALPASIQGAVGSLLDSVVGTGMLPSQSVMLAKPGGSEPAANSGYGTGQKEPATLSVTVVPPTSDFAAAGRDRVSNGIGQMVGVPASGTIQARSMSVARFGRQASFAGVTNSRSSVEEFPIAGSKPVALVILGVGGARPYPFRSGSIAP